MYRVVQPKGHPVGDWAVLSHHGTSAAAFAEIEKIFDLMRRTGMPADTTELIVINEKGQRVTRLSP